ncbi:hypothetical protein HID58_045496 [Brassica napus]|uniref:Glutaredoxin domain-containing protein n=1 Tax=Brassica napus TaxID=3708 RepID=A0ABQ8AUN3_BRANA|nr:hypothetical protein HID58_045496 [Brassica napus]
MEMITKMVLERPVVIYSKTSCCMSHTVKTLLCDFGANPAVHELDEIPRGREIEQALLRLGCSPAVPAIFIGGELVGGANEVMSLHLNGSLIPMLKQAGAFKEKLGLKLAQGEANSLSNMVHFDNVRLEHDVALELHSTRGVLAGERARMFQLQKKKSKTNMDV